ncbi:hypothetical protein OROGR_032869 [Orobanche gracilis]
MEESEKRKERLEAMRIEAAGTRAYTDSESPGLATGALSNPLIESETASASPHHYTSPRFDYYTDPLSAFSASKRANNISPQVSQGHYGTPPTELRPDSYYSKEMVKDPWESLSPVIWKGFCSLDSSDKSWLPNSIAMKKSKVSSEAPQMSISQQSLAEYLAVSFDD